MALTDLLHDDIDARESVRNDIADRVYGIVRANLEKALEETGDIGKAMAVLAEMVEDELTEVTTEEFQRAAKAATERSKP